MERIIKIGQTLRNNWKKSTVGAIAVAYGVAFAKEKYEINILMRAACKEAASYGDVLIPMERNPTLVTVILNPVANKRKAKKDFEKYCEPLLHLAGLQVDVIQTASEGNAKEIVETLRGTEAIIIAGGNGTVCETVTGLLRRNDDANQFPLGVLPLGYTNTLGNIMFPGGKGVERVKQLIDASMAIIQGHTEWRDAMKIEPIQDEQEENLALSKPVYAMTSMEWGAFRDAVAKTEKYWFYGPLKEYATYIFNGYKDSLTWNCSGTIKYTPPCAGCRNCMVKKAEVKRKWSFFIPATQANQSSESVAENPECLKNEELCFKTCEFNINTPNLDKSQDLSALSIVIGKNHYSYTDFVAEGWNRVKGKIDLKHTIPARTIEFFPQKTSDKEVFIGIDNEEFEVKPVKITLLPKVIKLFCKPQINV